MQVQNPSLLQICLKKKMTRWRQKKELSGKEAVIDKELLEAFRCFDWNQTGYIRVEDMRLIIHSLGTFLSHTEVKVRTVLLYPLSFSHKGCTRTNVLFLVSNGF
ncbi:protein SHORT ROOT IN SALT MEDIUM 1-like [Populus trichocarpa]|uniref:protein SHORT ROOT IN SALT MEDIUM 1-like n=1 Tax=Populus trichocarpa TaxID=3694 RepID=UPI00227973FB|nr:protein SHORT ROOT IN SALT MEDIUM 1-like [Populus trichocarpa]